MTAGAYILYASQLIGAAGVVAGTVSAVTVWLLKIKKQESDIKCIKRENTLICFALSACLDGLAQLGANHTVPKARDKLDKYLNQQAHR